MEGASLQEKWLGAPTEEASWNSALKSPFVVNGLTFEEYQT